MFKPAKVADVHWRKLNGFAWLTKVITDVRFLGGLEVRDDSTVQSASAAA